MHTCRAKARLLARLAPWFLLYMICFAGLAAADDSATESVEELRKRREDFSHLGCISDQECKAPQQCQIRQPTAGQNISLGQCNLTVMPGVIASNCLQNDWKTRCSLELEGSITAETATAINTFIDDLPFWSKQQVSMLLNSNGGDVDAAMAIGRLLRSRNAAASVGVYGSCASACVLVLAGAVKRDVYGPVIIHRPYRAAAVTYGPAAAQVRFNQRSEQMTTYLQEMNIPVSLYEAMLAVPSESGRRLTKAELNYYRLDSADLVYQEEQNASEAEMRGLSMTEYLQRKRAVDECAHQVTGKTLAEKLPGIKKCAALWGR